ncbi:Zn-ribbon domain-containing OB-fold protein [Natrinema amylolyticum]|uniref:Zn-ribbon domain-containing OB-fold protein n=1 Tax=Natrinema amylolyticum TaxID=2878679 RepID=UPI001CFA5740|nr:OB-fold domain-containing protein [Natrinema amylolyticum]
MDAASDPFWDALEDGRFSLPSCRDCGEPFFPPAPVCPRCHARDVEWIESDAEGTLYAVTRQHRTAPGIPSPLVLGVVELDEGPRLLARVQAEYGDLEIGTRLRLEPCEYEGPVDRGRLSDRPFFEARPVE